MQNKANSGSAPVRLRLIECGSLVVLLLWAFAISALSAEKPAAAPLPAPAQKSAEAPVAIEVTDVIPRSARALDRLREIREKLDADNSVSVVEAGLPAFTQQLDEWWKAEASTIKKSRSVQRIANWQATQLALTKTAPAAVRDKIIEVLREAEATGRWFRERTAQLVAVQGQLAARLERLDEIRKEIEAIRQQSSLDLLSQDNPPLWTAIFSADATESIASQASESAAKLYRDAVDFFQLYRKRLLLHLTLFLVTVALFSRLRYLARLDSAIKPTVAERFVLDRSISSALLLALICVPLFYSGASPNIMRIGIIPVVIPILILLPGIFSARYRLGFYLLTVIYLLDFLRAYLPPQWLLVRLLLLAAAFLGAVGIGLMDSFSAPYRNGAFRRLGRCECDW